MKTVQEKMKYLEQKWGFVVIEADWGAPVFIFEEGISKRPKGPAIYCCRNYSVKNGEYLNAEGDPFWGKAKEFCGLSFKEVVSLAYSSERIGEQLQLSL